MKTVLGAALEVQRYLSRVGERFCFIGGIALQRWGEPRLTRDVDVTVLSPFGEEGHSADRLLAAFRPRIEDAREFAVRNRVLLIQSEGGIAVDVAFGAVPFEELEPLAAVRDVPGLLDRLRQLQQDVSRQD